MGDYEIKYNTKTEILSAIEMLIDKISVTEGVYASIHLFGDGNTTISIYPTDEESEGID